MSDRGVKTESGTTIFLRANITAVHREYILGGVSSPVRLYRWDRNKVISLMDYRTGSLTIVTRSWRRKYVGRSDSSKNNRVVIGGDINRAYQFT